MEPGAAWGPCEFQLANWTVEDPADGEVWAPAACGLPVEYASIDMFADTWSLQPHVGSSCRGGQQEQQLVEYDYYYAAATQHQDGLIFQKSAAAPRESLEVDLIHDMEMEIFRCSKQEQIIDPEVLQEAAHNFKTGLKHAENVKHVAAYYCIKDSGCTVQELCSAVISVVAEIGARRLYSEDVMEGICDDKFLRMLVYDACFLVIYMLKLSGEECNAMLSDFIESNANDIDHDLMLLENQIPWPVVDAIMKKHKAVSLAEFIEGWKDGRLLDSVDEVPTTHDLDKMYEPPHLLGLLRFHIVGKNRKTKVRGSEKMKSIAISVSAIELAEMGINLKASKKTELAHMDLTNRPIFFGELSMAPLSLNDLRASLLVNMAAHELCTTPDFFDEKAKCEDSAVCSYLLLLCMLVHREEDVHQLRKKRILRGGAGFTNQKVLDFVTYLQNLKDGPCYGRVMVHIESYRTKRQLRIMVYAFFYNNCKTIITVISAISVFIGILSAIKSLKGAH
ncbi:unnamed protein product [Urochloa decumbens]|uniref:Uncharacterized protein n=1 Tax=Urochloa decumbens TaxID=240449 RepID=A0ABC9AHY7_9POAL